MRYHSRLPLSPNGLLGFSSQRSDPTCSLSLANVSASGTTSSNREAQVHDMEIDSLNTLVPVTPATEKRCAIPFPKRPHSLLRSTPPSPASRPHATSGVRSKSSAPHECDEEEEENSAHDQDPPRKRTRTSAISTSTRTRPGSRRVAPLPPRPQSPVAIVEQSPHTHLSPTPTSSPIPVESPVSSCINISSSQPLSPPSLSQPTLPSSVSPRVPFPSSKSSSHTRPPTSSIPRRRRASPEETATSLRLYKMLLCGLEAKYGGQQDSSRTSSATAYLEAVLKDTRSSLDVQDALLAQRLRTWLVINGVDMRQVSIDIENESSTSSSSSSPSSSCDTPMSVDIPEHSASPPGTSQSQENWQTSTSTSTTSPRPTFISSYQRHFATALLRHQNRLSSRGALRASKRPPSQASSLAVEYDFKLERGLQVGRGLE